MIRTPVVDLHNNATEISTAINDGFHSRLSQLWSQLALRSGLTHGHRAHWRTQTFPFESLYDWGSCLGEDLSTGSSHEFLLDADGVLILVSAQLGSGLVSVQMAGSPAVRKRFRDVECAMRAIFSSAEVESHIPVTFWYRDSRGSPASSRRELEAPHWGDVAPNYPAPTRRALESMLARPRGHLPQLDVWHGPPGTGKTWALRAIAREWGDFCSIEFVTDPDTFFESSNYMMRVLLEEAVDDRSRGCRMLILEDAGAMLARDPHPDDQRRLVRLLNLTDGFIGQGLRTSILFTTNEPLQALHPAIERPGRCASLISFRHFDAGEAQSWLAARGHSEAPTGPLTLAEMFQRVRGVDVVEHKKVPLGFHPSPRKRARSS